MWKKLKLWLFPTEVEGYNYNAVDRDKDGLVQEGTPFERRIETMNTKPKKAASKKKKAPVKKAPVKKPVKKTTKKKK